MLEENGYQSDDMKFIFNSGYVDRRTGYIAGVKLEKDTKIYSELLSELYSRGVRRQKEF